MILLSVCRKNLTSSLRGEYIDFIVSRFTFTLFTMASALVLFHMKGGSVSTSFLKATGHGDYIGYMIAGTALYGTTHGILLNVSRTLMTERREGTLESVLIIPFPRWQYYGGNQLHQLMLTGLDILLALIIAIPLGVHFKVSLPGLIMALFQFFVTLYGLALIISLVMITLRDTFFIQNTIIPIILMIGGYLFPVDVLPFPLKALASIIPVHSGVEMFRGAVLRGVAAPPDLTYILALLPGALFLTGGYLLLPHIERKALENYLS